MAVASRLAAEKRFEVKVVDAKEIRRVDNSKHITRLRFLRDWPSRVLAIAFFGSALALAARGMEHSIAPVALTPEEMHWMTQGALSAPGMEQVNLVGDPAKPGPYTLRLKFPKGVKIAPHTHPDAREVTVLSGLYASGYGERFDTDRLKPLPAGSFYTEPKNVPHYIEIKEDTVLQVSGMGPSQRNLVAPTEPTK
jgi:quercetin dioxygenase-like cupin family protein